MPYCLPPLRVLSIGLFWDLRALGGLASKNQQDRPQDLLQNVLSVSGKTQLSQFDEALSFASCVMKLSGGESKRLGKDK